MAARSSEIIFFFHGFFPQYIRDHYHEDPDSYSAEIHELEGLRASAIHASRDFTGCSTLKKYYCQLHYLLSRFPLNENSSIAVTFNWWVCLFGTDGLEFAYFFILLFSEMQYCLVADNKLDSGARIRLVIFGPYFIRLLSSNHNPN